MTLKSVLTIHTTEKVMHMNLDLGPLSPLLSQIQFPISKADLIQAVQQKGASNQVTSLLQRLPDKTFNSLQDVQNELGGLGNIGNIKL
jgi:Protein of unknown function (DUF2795)